MPPAGGKGPHAGHPEAALAFDRANLGAGAPRQHRARIAEDRLRHRQVEIGRRHRAAAGLAEAPGGGSISFGDGFDDMEEGYGIGFDPVGRAGQQQPEQLRVVQLVEQRGRQPARGLDIARKRSRHQHVRPAAAGRSPPGRRQDRQNLRSAYSRPWASRAQSCPCASSLVEIPIDCHRRDRQVHDGRGAHLRMSDWDFVPLWHNWSFSQSQPHCGDRQTRA